MGEKQFRCRGCHKVQRQRVVGQQYCGARTCQQKRKNRWRREHYASDESYRLTAQASTAAWLKSQGGAGAYYRNYRQRRKQDRHEDAPSGATKPAVTDAVDPASAPKGTRGRGANTDANSDAETAQVSVSNGQYLLIAAGGAKRDAILVQLLAITGETGDLQRTTCFSGDCGDVMVEP